MLARDAFAEFQCFLAKRGVVLPSVSPRVAAEAMFAFFRDVEATDCDAAAAGDMLLFQWGTYDWGWGRFFECDITRQFITGGGEDDDIWQLHFTVRFRPTAELSALGWGSRWCPSREEIDPFTSFVFGSQAFAAVADSQDGDAELDYECAG